MIPLRITVAGFLSYREERTARFDGHALWMLTGANGSGKSSLFDAVTYALYDQHRGRVQEGLINQHSDQFRVEFEFLLDGEQYLIHRTLNRKGKSTRSIQQWQAASGQWREIEQTGGRAGFQDWIRDHLGLDFGTFTQSVMLLQGKSNELLDKSPALRHTALGEIVGLSRYEKLHELTKERRKQFQIRTEALALRLQEQPPVSDGEIQAAEQSAAEWQQELVRLATALDQAETLLQQSRLWQEHQVELEELTRQEEQLRETLREGERIQQEYIEHQLLQQSLPMLREWAEGEQERETLGEQERQLESQRQEVQARQSQLEAELGSRQEQLDQALRRQRQLEHELQELDRRFSQQESAGPWLELFHRQRETLRAAESALQEVSRELHDLQERRRRHQSEQVAADTLQQLARECEQVREQHSQASVRLEQSEERWQRFQSLGTASECPYCGQELQPDHREQESQRLQHERHNARSQEETARQELNRLQAEHQELTRRQTAWEQQLARLEQRLQTTTFQRNQAGTSRQQAAEQCHHAWQLLPEDLRTRIASTPPASWSETTWPTPADLEQSRQELQSMKDRCGTIRQQRDKLTAAIEQQQTQLEQARRQQPELLRSMSEIHSDLSRIHGQQALRQSRQERTWQRLPETWQEWDSALARQQTKTLSARLQALINSEILQRHQQLERAATQQELLQSRQTELRAKIATIPELARRSPDLLEAERKQQRETHDQTVAALRDTQQQAARLREQQTVRQQLDQQYRAADRLRTLWGRLMELLSRDGLQRALVRSAEEQITRHADTILDRLSGGSMRMELSPPSDEPGSETALDLQVCTDASEHPLNASLLSGSQKFRVSVALALAIGQYASRNNRPARCLVIDEGFGSLDQEGAASMIQELHQLGTQLDKIIVVSHQEAFQEAFHHGYLVSLDDTGSSLLIEFHR